MKRLVLSFMVLSSLVFGGDKITFTSANIMCVDKKAELLPYLLLLNEAMNKDAKAINNAVATIKKHSNNTCGLLNPSTNVIAKIVRKQKDIVKNTAIEYIQYEIITVNGNPMNNFKMWSVVLSNSNMYKVIN